MNETIASFHQHNATELEIEWKSQDSLSTYQAVAFIWSIVCLLPNAILIHLLVKKTPRQSHLHFAVRHWSICNVILIVSAIHWTVVPLKYLSFRIWESTYLFSMSFITLTSVLVTILTAYMRPESRRGKYCMFRFWLLVGILVIVAFVSVFVEYIRIALMIFSAGLIATICLVVLIIKIILWWRNNNSTSDDESYEARLAMAFIYVAIPFVHMCFFLCGYHWVALFELLKLVIFADGFANLGFLLQFDETVKNTFINLFNVKIAEEPA